MYDNNLLDKIKKDTSDWVHSYRKERLKDFQFSSFPAWKRLKVKEFSLPDFKKYNKPYLYFSESAKVSPFNIKEINFLSQEDYFLNQYMEVQERFGIGEKFVALGETFFNSGACIHIPKDIKIKEPIFLNFNLDKTNSVLIDQNLIIGEKNSEVTVVIQYDSKEKLKGFHNGITKVYAEDGAKINIIKVQNFNEETTHFDSNVGFINQDAEINWIFVELGSQMDVSSCVNYLKETNSNSNLYSIYLGDRNKKMDIEYSMYHKGRKSKSNIQVRGVLKDSAYKVFRGNLDFKKGATASVGSENEYVILLDPTVKSDAIPALLCEEDDVVGQHAASAGQINENKLFYLMSRGLTEKEAKKLMVEASFRPIINQIPMENIKVYIEKEMNRRLVYGQ